jgi:hypothetical protein
MTHAALGIVRSQQSLQFGASHEDDLLPLRPPGSGIAPPARKPKGPYNPVRMRGAITHSPSSQVVRTESSANLAAKAHRAARLLTSLEPGSNIGFAESNVSAQPNVRDRTGPGRLKHPAFRDREQLGDRSRIQEPLAHTHTNIDTR